MDGDREKAKRAAEQTFAILTATYHDLPERDALIGELTPAEAMAVVRLMAELLRGTFISAEVRARTGAGSALPLVVEHLHRDAPWLQ